MRKWLLTIGLVWFAISASAGTISGTVSVKGLRKKQDILVFIEKVGDNNFAPPEKNPLMDQINMVFTPFVLPVVVGTTVDFRNSDNVLHNVFTPDAVAEKFNLGTWPKGQIRFYTFKRPGVAVILCNVHPEMEAYVAVLKNPYFAVTDKEGKFTIPALDKDKKPTAAELPAGTYRLHTWHPKLKSVVQEVTVPAEGAVEVSLSLRRGKPDKIEDLYKE